MTVKQLKPTTPQEQKDALDVIIRMALTNDEGSTMTNELPLMLGTLQRSAGVRVADIMVMLAGAAVPDSRDWVTLLKENIQAAGGEKHIHRAGWRGRLASGDVMTMKTGWKNQ